MSERLTALIAGSTGMIGNRLAHHFAANGKWHVIGLTRRQRAPQDGIRYVAVDLADAEGCRSALAPLREITHVFYAARGDHPRMGEQEPVQQNAAMFANVVSAAAEAAARLQHVHVVHGTKYYGSNLGPFKTPAKESDPRGSVDNFYFAQEDYLLRAPAQRSWRWSISRPAGIYDPSLGEPRNIVRIIGVYAAILRELGEPLYFPGTEANFHCLYQFADARLLARAVEWIATEPHCADAAFNVTNGDYFRWINLWPRLADHFGMPAGPVRPAKLRETMADKADVWARVVKKFGLSETPYGRTALWGYADYVFGTNYDVMSDTTKLRRAGFSACLDTEENMLELLQLFSGQKILP